MSKSLNLRFNIFLASVFCFATVVAQQETEVVTDSVVQATFFRFHFDFGTGISPQASGDNFIADGYDLSRTIDLGMTFSNKFVTLHIDRTVYSGDVIDQSVVGNYNSTRFGRTSVGVGYPWNITNKFTVNPSIHYGYLRLKSDLEGGEELRDEGQFIGVDLKLTYEVVDWFSFYVGVSGYQDFLNIEAPGAIQDSFDRSSLIVPSIGLRLSTRKIPLKKGEPGDGIFSRRDDL